MQSSCLDAGTASVISPLTGQCHRGARAHRCVRKMCSSEYLISSIASSQVRYTTLKTPTQPQS